MELDVWKYATIILGVVVLIQVTPMITGLSILFSADNPVTIYFFYGEGCGYCARAEPFLEGLTEDPLVDLVSFEVWGNETNAALLSEAASAYGFSVSGVPVVLIGDQYWVGYTESIGAEMESYINDCLVNGCTPIWSN